MNRTVYKGIMDGIVIDHVIRDESFIMPTKHFHREYEIYYLLDGSRYYFIDNQTYHIHKGTLVIIDSQQIHKTEPADVLFHNRILLEFTHEPFCHFFTKLSPVSLDAFFKKYHGILVLDEKGQKTVENLLSAMMKEIKNQHFNYETIAMMKLTELIFYIIRSLSDLNNVLKPKPSDTPKHKIVHDVAHHISTHYVNNISLDYLSENFYINKSYLSRIYKEVTGYTITEFINITRIKAAQALLVNSDLSISHIANQVGYESHTYLERNFKKYLETSPLKYRKKANLAKEKSRERS